ncbi:MAG TPA: hypothetical protein VI387_01095 [Candidatus Brocadiales bacterium]|nr:hypothetical protein [Candidatus Brocadiales bacterium]
MQIAEVKRPSKEVLAKVQSLKGKKGMIVAIEPETGDWFLGKNVLEALGKGRKKYSQGIFYFVRIGYPFAHGHKGGIRRI